MKLGIIREGKNPPDKRVPLTPLQCVEVMQKYPEVDIFVQKSPIRIFKDHEYSNLGIKVVNKLDECDVILGVKEVNIEDLIPGKHFFFFSHTFKKQPYNRDLLRAIIDKKIQLTDYEALTDVDNRRLLGFGRYAGIVGCYNTLLAYGLKHDLYTLKPAHQCSDRKEMEAELSKIKFPAHTKIVATGFGRVGQGADEILRMLPIKEVEPEEFLAHEFDTPVFTQLNISDYVAHERGEEFDTSEFYADNTGYISTFPRYLKQADIFIACHFWKEGSPYLFTRDDIKSDDIRVSVIGDISCDIDGPVASTIRPSTIKDPLYGYHPGEEKEVDFKDKNAIAVMAVDNLPCELPKDASEDFGENLMKYIFPALFRYDPFNIIARGSETSKAGQLTAYFSFLQDYLDGKE